MDIITLFEGGNLSGVNIWMHLVMKALERERERPGHEMIHEGVV